MGLEMLIPRANTVQKEVIKVNKVEYISGRVGAIYQQKAGDLLTSSPSWSTSTAARISQTERDQVPWSYSSSGLEKFLSTSVR